MKSLSDIERELKMLGIHIRFWSRPELKELAHILTDDEQITTAASGRYQGGFALIATTNHRLLLVDKKMWFMSLEDVRFDMITEVDYSARVFDSTVSVRTINKVLTFTSVSQKQLRELARYLQARILELRQMMMQQSQVPAAQALAQADLPLDVNNSYQPQSTPLPNYEPPALQAPVALESPPAPAPMPLQPPVQAPAAPSTKVYYTRPSRLRRMGAFPTASFTMTNQRYLTR